jgi:TatD DNase family protein
VLIDSREHVLIDSHCHLDDEQFDADRDAVIERARAAGVARMLAVGTGKGPPDLEAGIRLAQRYDFIHATAGVHPHDASKAGPETFEALRELLRQRKVAAVGEIGLDYHYNFSPQATQRQVFAEQLKLAREAGLPVVIHTREAWEDTLALIKENWDARIGGVFHCFAGGPLEAEQVLELGFHVSFSGMVTFSKAGQVQEAARVVPRNRLLIETDAPYLAPVPHRGKRNEPAYMALTARKLAGLRGESFEEVADVTSGNFLALFGVR